MGLFVSKEVKEGKIIVKRALDSAALRLPCFMGAHYEDYCDNSIVSFVCDEENFGTGFVKALGSGSHCGYVSVAYNPKENYLVGEFIYSKKLRSADELYRRAGYSGGFSVVVHNGDTHPDVYISKLGVTFANLEREVEALLQAMSNIMD